MLNLSTEIIKFANGNTDYFVAFSDYYNNHDKMTAEQSEKIHNAFFAEVEKRSGIQRNAENADSWAANPNVRWAAMAVIDATINSVLPQTLNTTVGIFTDMRFVSYGDIVKFKIKPRTLYTVTKGSHGNRTTFRQKKYDGDIVLAPSEHLVTVYTDMYRVLAGKEDLAEFVRMVVMSIETEMGKDAANALIDGITNVNYPAQFRKTGAFDTETLINLGESVQAYNFGAKPIVLGTAAALAKVAPDSALGFRGIYDAKGGEVSVMKDFYGYTLMVLPNYAKGSTPDAGLALPDNQLFVISPAMDKLVKGAVSNTLTNSNNFYDNADLTSNFTMRKDWDFEFASAAWGGVYTITE